MNKKIIKNIFIILIFTLTSCSYEPVFLKKDYGFEINKINLSGEKDINRTINQRLQLISKSKIEKKNSFDLKIVSKKLKKIISKDTQGDPSKFELVIFTDFEIIEDDKILLKRNIEKSYIYNNTTDKFKLEQNEKIIIDNLSEKISEVIISLILNINDS